MKRNAANDSMNLFLTVTCEEYKAFLEAQVRLSAIRNYLSGSDYANREALLVLAGLDLEEKSSP